MQYCKMCGHEVDPKSQKFCDNCGAPLEPESSAPQVEKSSTPKPAKSLSLATLRMMLQSPFVWGIGTFLVLELLIILVLGGKGTDHLVDVLIGVSVFIGKYAVRICKSVHEDFIRSLNIVIASYLPFMVDLVFKWTGDHGLISWLVLPTFVVTAIVLILALKKPFLFRIMGIIALFYLLYATAFLMRGDYFGAVLNSSIIEGYWFALPMCMQSLACGSLAVLVLAISQGGFVAEVKIHPKRRFGLRNILFGIALALAVYCLSIPIHYVMTQSVREHDALARIFFAWQDHVNTAANLTAGRKLWPEEVPVFQISQYADFEVNNWQKERIQAAELRKWLDRFAQTGSGLFQMQESKSTGYITYWSVTPCREFEKRWKEIVGLNEEFHSFMVANGGGLWAQSANFPLPYRFSSLEVW
jgi:hypothetical protein